MALCCWYGSRLRSRISLPTATFGQIRRKHSTDKVKAMLVHQLLPFFCLLTSQTVEIFSQHSGYRLGVDQVTLHARDRYRLRAQQDSVPNQLIPDPSLWIVHYHRSEPRHQMPVHSVPPNEYMLNLMRERNALHSSGRLQLRVKNFMLHDRSNWPSIQLPGTSTHPYVQQTTGYPNNVMAQMNRNQPAGYGPNPQVALAQRPPSQPASKRPRNASMGHPNDPNAGYPQPSQQKRVIGPDDDLNADSMDFLTPQDISTVRYKQHHEWLEEILNSPYDTHRIVPGELGLGRKGELETLTKDFFKAHTGIPHGQELALPRNPTKEDYYAGTKVVEDGSLPSIGRLEAGKANDFRTSAARRIEDIRAEIEELKVKHANTMEKITAGRQWKEADRLLRSDTATGIHGQTPENPSFEIERLIEGKEASLRRRVRPIKAVHCVDKGGLEDKATASAKEQPIENAGNQLQDTNSKTDSPSGAESSSPTGQAVNARIMSSRDESESDGPPANGPQESIASPAVATEDWVMVNKDEDVTTHAHTGNQSTYDTLERDAPATVKEDGGTFADMPDAAAPLDDPLDYQGTEFEAGLEFADIQMTEPDMAGYAQEIENMGALEPPNLGVGNDVGAAESPEIRSPPEVSGGSGTEP